MADSIYQMIEVVGTSPNSIEDAVNNALGSKAMEQHRPRWFQIVETRGAIKESKVSEWQVTVKVGVKA